MGASISKIRDRIQLRTQDTEKTDRPEPVTPEWSRHESLWPTAYSAGQTSAWEVVSAQRLVVATGEDLQCPLAAAPTSPFTSYMPFPNPYSFLQQNSFLNPSHLVQGDRLRADAAHHALAHLQDRCRYLELENERLHHLLNQSRSLGIEKYNLETRNRDLQQRLARAKEHWEIQERQIEELNTKLLTQEGRLRPLGALQRQAEQVQRYKSLLAAKENELVLAQRQIEEDKLAIWEFERLHRLDLVFRAKVAHLERELSEAKTVITVLKDELERREDTEFFTPTTSEKSTNKNKSPKTPVKAPSSPAPHKMVDDEISSTSSHHSGMQLRSRKVPRPPALARSRSPRLTTSRRGEGGVAALLVGNGPSMTSEDDRSLPSASSQANDKEDNEPFDLRTNRRNKGTSITDNLDTKKKLTGEGEIVTQLQNIMQMLTNLKVQQEEQKREQQQQRQEQLKQRKLLEGLLRSDQQQPNEGTHQEVEATADEDYCEKEINLGQPQTDTHEIWTPRLNDPAAETNLTKHSRPLQSYYVIIHRWHIESDEYEPTWEGLKKFVSAWYGHAEEHTVREKFKRLKWKGSVEQLDKNLRAALDVCTTIPDVDLSSTFVALIPDGMRAFWLSKKTPNDRYKNTVAICLDYERSQHQWMQRSGLQSSATPSSPLDRGLKTQQRQMRDATLKNYNANQSKPVPPDRLGPCRHCKGRGHYAQACANLQNESQKSSAGNDSKPKSLEVDDDVVVQMDKCEALIQEEHEGLDMLRKLVATWPAPTVEEWQEAGAREALPLRVMGSPTPQNLKGLTHTDEGSDEEELLDESTTDTRKTTRKEEWKEDRDPTTQSHDQTEGETYDRRKTEKTPRGKKQKIVSQTEVEPRSCEKAGRDEASDPQEDESTPRNATKGSRRRPVTAPAQDALFPLCADVPAPPVGAHAPHQLGGSSERKEVEERRAVQEKEVLSCSPPLEASSTAAEALRLSRLNPNNSNDACGRNKPATADTLSCPNGLDNTQSPNECADHQRRTDSLRGESESAKGQAHQGEPSTPTNKGGGQIDPALILSAGPPPETHPDNLGTGPIEEDKERIRGLLIKWLGPCSAALFLRGRRRPWAGSGAEKGLEVERVPTPKVRPGQNAQDLQAEEAVEDCMKEERGARGPQRSRSQRTQQRWSGTGDLELSKGQELVAQEKKESQAETRTALAHDSLTLSQQYSNASSSTQQPSPTVAQEGKDRPTASPEMTQGAADCHPLAFLKLTIKGKPVIALLDTGCTHVLISSDLADELQLRRRTLESPTKMLLGNGEEMEMKEMTKDLKCKAGELYFKLNAVLAPIPFELILGHPFLHKERLLWGFGPGKLTGWRGGRRLVLPISEERPSGKITSPEREKLWKDREEIKAAHELLERALKDRSREEAEAMVRPSPKRYKNFKTAACRAHARKLAILAREQAEGNLNLYIWNRVRQGNKEDIATGSREARGEAPDGGPSAPKPRDGTTDLFSSLEKAAPESKYLVIPKELSFQAQTEFIPTYTKFDALSREWKETMPSGSYQMLLQHRDLFPDSLPPGSPARRIIDHHIPTVPDKLPPKGPIYQMDTKMKLAMKEELAKLASKGYITLTSSPYAAACMLVPKKSDKPGGPEQYRLVNNYQELNKLTISCEQPIPNITTIMEQLQGAKYFTIMDVESGFHQVRVAPEDQHKTAFRCYLGHFEFKVMPFGLKGAPGTFQAIMTQILWEHIGIRCAVYLDDVLVYSATLEKHIEDVAKVLRALRDHKMFPKISKCKFAKTELVHLG
ncbi:hypothetical protein Emag_006777 [Eimeria magna]